MCILKSVLSSQLLVCWYRITMRFYLVIIMFGVIYCRQDHNNIGANILIEDTIMNKSHSQMPLGNIWFLLSLDWLQSFVNASTVYPCI